MRNSTEYKGYHIQYYQGRDGRWVGTVPDTLETDDPIMRNAVDSATVIARVQQSIDVRLEMGKSIKLTTSKADIESIDAVQRWLKA